MIIRKSVDFKKHQLRELEPELSAFRDKMIALTGATGDVDIHARQHCGHVEVTIVWQEDEVRPGITKEPK